MDDLDLQRDRWTQVKSRIIGLWSNISDEDLERTRGNFSAISHLILHKYKESKETVVFKIAEALHANSFDEETNN